MIVCSTAPASTALRFSAGMAFMIGIMQWCSQSMVMEHLLMFIVLVCNSDGRSRGQG